MSARNEELEQLILADRASPGSYLVYADWLAARGDPRGELIVLQHQLSQGVARPDDPRVLREQAILAAAERFLPGVPASMVHTTWRWGFLDSVHFNNDDDWMDASVPVEAITATVFGSGATHLLDELRIGVMRWDDSNTDVPAILEEAARSPAGASVRRIHVGDFGDSDVDLGMYDPGRLSLTGRFPRLRSLLIRGSQFDLDPFDFPLLDTLTIETCGLAKDALEAVLASSLPSLTTLRLWFGSERYGAECTASDLAPLLERAPFPRLAHLGLMNSEFADDLPLALARSRILPSLRSLDLSMGTMSSVGVRAILEHREAFQHLRSLSVSENFLDDADLEQLAELGPAIDDADQKEDDLSVPGEVHRYVSVHE